ncbi:D-aspartate oxidase [Orussus abietinus]|uniref:D-aspartate oxidase n=1 Tax=Orussus abietinus TaxID=222816 RepID=UPI0006268873|nr:D-aspartate oxidase [Orussus abietinus]
MKIAVVGGGVVGLTSALEVQRELRNAEVTVFAANFEDTVSHVAAGIFRIGSSYSGPTEEITRKWVKDSYEYYDDIRRSPEASLAGVTSISGYIFANSNPNVVKSRWLEEVVPVYRRTTHEEHQLVGGSWKYGSFFTTLLTQCDLYLPWARNRLQQNGAKLVQKKIYSLKELCPEYQLIINCTGFGARELCNDRSVIPIRGQVLKVKAPWMKTCFYGELDTYVIPGYGGLCTLGGSRHFDSETTQICPYEITAIRERCERLVPSLKSAIPVTQLTGIRPHREGSVRVEPDRIEGSLTKVVHNYGHGGYGVCTSPGTAKYTVYWAKEILKSSNKL